MTTTLVNDELFETIILESRRGAEKYGYKYHVDVDEMESWLISEIYPAIIGNPDMQNIKGIRHIIRLRSVDYMRELVRNNAAVNFSTLSKHVNDGTESCDMEQLFENMKIQSPDDAIKENELKEFLDSLPTQERQIIELSVGITDSLDKQQMTKVKNMIDQKASKEKNLHKEINVWFTTYDISEVLGIHRNTINNTLKRTREKALDFGLWC